VFGEHQPGWSGSVPQILMDESNPHLRGIFHSGANPTLPSSNQTATGTGSLRPGSLRSPTKHTGRGHRGLNSCDASKHERSLINLDATELVKQPLLIGIRPSGMKHRHCLPVALVTLHRNYSLLTTLTHFLLHILNPTAV